MLYFSRLFTKTLILVSLFIAFSVVQINALPSFDSDGKADFGVFRSADRTWYSYSTQSQTYSAVQWGLPNDASIPADYDGDGITDIAVWRPESGVWYILPSRNGQPFIIEWGTTTSVPFGYVLDEPVPADYDGDGQTDIAVWRPANGVWYVLKSTSGYNAEDAQIFHWGKLGDIPVPADYDGDGKADFAIFRPTENRWYILQSESGKWKVSTFGRSGFDLLVPADYTGDGRSDIAIYRNGTWYIERSEDGQVIVYQFGLSTDTPVPADYDDDGKADIAVFRQGTWYVFESSTLQPKVFNFGLSGDSPTKSNSVGKVSIVAIP